MALLLDGLCSLPFQQSMAATQLAVRWLLVGLDGLGSLLLGLALDGLGNLPLGMAPNGNGGSPLGLHRARLLWQLAAQHGA